MPHDKIACPSCGKRYRWKDEMAGRKVKCQCEAIFRLPTTSDGEPELVTPGRSPGKSTSSHPAPPVTGSITEKTGPLSDGYDLHDSHLGPAAPAPGSSQGTSATPAVCPACNQPVKAGAMLCVNCGFNLKSGQRVQTKVGKAVEDDDLPRGAAAAAALSGTSRVARALEDREDDTPASRWKDIYLPAGLIVLGLIMAFVEQMYFIEDASEGLASAAISVGIDLFISVPILFVAMLLAVKLLDVSFGPLMQALFKLVAIALGPGAIGSIIAFALGGGLVGWFAGAMAAMIAYWSLLSVLLDLDAMEALYMMFIIWVVQYVAGFLALVVLGAMFA